MDFNKGTLSTAEEQNSDTVITISCGSEESVYITHISASYDGQLSNNQRAITIEDSNGVIWKYWAYREDVKNFGFSETPLKGNQGEDLTITLQASGETSVSGRLNVISHVHGNYS